MAKKIEEAEVKKECPSCGLGVALDATICEFCGWDFEEEDEWILQIEKLERELLLEKQKFEPGSVEGKIESTLHTPAIERIEMRKAAVAKAAEEARATPKASAPPPSRAPGLTRELKQSEFKTPRPSPPAAAPSQAVKPAPQQERPEAPKVRRVRSVKAAPAAESAPEPDVGSAPKKSRVVRKVKQ